MEHEEFKILVSAYHDGEVTPEERALVEAHLAECAECAEAFAAYGRLGRTLQRLPRGEPSRGLWQRVQEGLASRRRWSLGWRLLPVAPVLAVVAIAITLIFVLGTPLSGDAPSPALQKEGGIAESTESDRGVPQASSMPAMAPQEVATEGAEEYGLHATPPGPAGLAELEVVSQTIRYDEDRTAPHLQGVLYDTAGQPLAGTALVVSDLVRWVGVVTTTVDGSFALDLPSGGTYYVALAGSPIAEKALGECWDLTADGVVSETGYLSATNALPAMVVLEGNDELVVTLRVR